MADKFHTPGETHEERAVFWLDIIKQARSYPGGVAKFCRDKGVGKESYYRWFHMLKHRVEAWNKPLDTNEKRRKNPPKQKSDKNIVRHTVREWTTLVEACVKSGLRPSSFARLNGLQKVTFCRWYRRLSKNKTKAKHQMSKKPNSEVVNFVPVKIVENAKKPLEAEPLAANSVEIVLPNNRTIRFREGCSIELLRNILLVLEER